MLTALLLKIQVFQNITLSLGEWFPMTQFHILGPESSTSHITASHKPNPSSELRGIVDTLLYPGSCGRQ